MLALYLLALFSADAFSGSRLLRTLFDTSYGSSTAISAAASTGSSSTCGPCTIQCNQTAPYCVCCNGENVCSTSVNCPASSSSSSGSSSYSTSATGTASSSGSYSSTGTSGSTSTTTTGCNCTSKIVVAIAFAGSITNTFQNVTCNGTNSTVGGSGYNNTSTTNTTIITNTTTITTNTTNVNGTVSSNTTSNSNSTTGGYSNSTANSTAGNGSITVGQANGTCLANITNTNRSLIFSGTRGQAAQNFNATTTMFVPGNNGKIIWVSWTSSNGSAFPFTIWKNGQIAYQYTLPNSNNSINSTTNSTTYFTNSTGNYLTNSSGTYFNNNSVTYVNSTGTYTTNSSGTYLVSNTTGPLTNSTSTSPSNSYAATAASLGAMINGVWLGATNNSIPFAPNDVIAVTVDNNVTGAFEINLSAVMLMPQTQ